MHTQQRALQGQGHAIGMLSVNATHHGFARRVGLDVLGQHVAHGLRVAGHDDAAVEVLQFKAQGLRWRMRRDLLGGEVQPIHHFASRQPHASNGQLGVQNLGRRVIEAHAVDHGIGHTVLKHWRAKQVLQVHGGRCRQPDDWAVKAAQHRVGIGQLRLQGVAGMAARLRSWVSRRVKPGRQVVQGQHQIELAHAPEFARFWPGECIGHAPHAAEHHAPSAVRQQGRSAWRQAQGLAQGMGLVDPRGCIGQGRAVVVQPQDVLHAACGQQVHQQSGRASVLAGARGQAQQHAALALRQSRFGGCHSLALVGLQQGTPSRGLQIGQGVVRRLGQHASQFFGLVKRGQIVRQALRIARVAAPNAALAGQAGRPWPPVGGVNHAQRNGQSCGQQHAAQLLRLELGQWQATGQVHACGLGLDQSHSAFAIKQHVVSPGQCIVWRRLWGERPVRNRLAAAGFRPRAKGVAELGAVHLPAGGAQLRIDQLARLELVQ